jgi:hypothetical protein
LKLLAEPLLRQVPYGTPEYIEAKRLLAFLEWFLPIDPDLIPDNSILREFTGGSICANLKYGTAPAGCWRCDQPAVMKLKPPGEIHRVVF